MELLTEKGFKATGIEMVLKRISVPKGSFYHYFDSKEAFGRALLAEYGHYFERKLKRILQNVDRNPLERIEDFVDEATAGMAKYQWRRGCLVGNLGQEVTVLPDAFRSQLEDVLASWQALLADCLREAQAQQLITQDFDCDVLAEFFWIGWEGAIMRARLSKSSRALAVFIQGFIAGIRR